MCRDEFYMLRCLQLAANGLGTTYPNPLVGAVVVHNDKIIGEGWHKNHHEDSRNWRIGKTLWQWDPGAWFIKIIKR